MCFVNKSRDKSSLGSQKSVFQQASWDHSSHSSHPTIGIVFLRKSGKLPQVLESWECRSRRGVKERAQTCTSTSAEHLQRPYESCIWERIGHLDTINSLCCFVSKQLRRSKIVSLGDFATNMSVIIHLFSRENITDLGSDQNIGNFECTVAVRTPKKYTIVKYKKIPV